MTIHLLTHEREKNRKTATGPVVEKALKNLCQIHTWQRKNPSELLSEHLPRGKTLLLYPGKESEEIRNIDDIQHIIIPDGTWQEAGKIYNRSPYLKQYPCVKLPHANRSNYTLRRNQKEAGLCTAECVIELLLLKGMKEEADKLQETLSDFILSFS